MIPVNRERVSRPKFFDSPAYARFVQELATFQREGGTRSKQEWFPWRERLRPFLTEAMPALNELFHDKCAYTEVGFGGKKPGKLILHRPPGDAIGVDGKASPEHYWWLIPEWTNWMLASPHVASVKETQFPVLGERTPVPSGDPPYASDEWPLLLDPCSTDPKDHPAWHLSFSRGGNVGALDVHSGTTVPSRRLRRASDLPGAHTIRALDLNNPRLTAGRKNAAVASDRTFRQVQAGKGDPEALFELLSDATEFAGAVRQACALRLLSNLDEKGRDLTARGFSAEQIVRMIDTLKTEIAASVMCDRPARRYTAAGRKLLRPLADHVSAAFNDTRLGALFRERLKGKRVIKDGTTVLPGAERGGPVPEEAPYPDAERPLVSRSAQITTIRIRNFRAIQELELSSADLNSDEMTVELAPEYGATDQRVMPSARRWWSLLGENGSGKSSILQATALALAGPSLDKVMHEAGLAWANLLRRPPPGAKERVVRGRVCLDFSDGTRIDLRFNKNTHWWVPDNRGAKNEASTEVAKRDGTPVIEVYVRAYGATRLLESDTPDRRHVRVTNLFEPRAGVTRCKDWLLSISDEDFNVAAPTIAALLHHEGLALEDAPARAPDEQLLARDPSKGEVTLEGLPFELASDGYRAVVALACDIMAGLGEGLSTMEHAPGIVLLDEIGAHLHPRWRMSITSKLRRALPSVQFIVSTHEPLCLRGLVAREVVRVTKHKVHGVLIDVIDRSPSYYRVDQLLTSEFFGLDTTIEPDLERRFQHYYRLLAKQDRSEEEEADLAVLYRYLQRHARPALGYTRREQLVYDEIDRYLSQRYTIDDESLSRADFVKRRKQARRAALERVRDIWERRRAVHDSGDGQ